MHTFYAVVTYSTGPSGAATVVMEANNVTKALYEVLRLHPTAIVRSIGQMGYASPFRFTA